MPKNLMVDTIERQSPRVYIACFFSAVYSVLIARHDKFVLISRGVSDDFPHGQLMEAQSNSCWTWDTRQYHGAHPRDDIGFDLESRKGHVCCASNTPSDSKLVGFHHRNILSTKAAAMRTITKKHNMWWRSDDWNSSISIHFKITCAIWWFVLLSAFT